MKKLVTVTYCYEIEVDETDPVVMEYESENELITDLCTYRFTTLPVLDRGVKVLDIEYLEHEVKNA